jgi:hypothetical protein
MSILTTELVLYSSANMPTADTGTSGGAIDTASRPELTQFAAPAIAQVVSDGADVRTVTVTGRLASGIIDTEVLTLNGTTPVSGAKTWERILKLVASATSGTRTISVKEGAGGTVRATISVNETTRLIMFYDSASSPTGSSARYEKTFFKNNNGTLALTGATVSLTADPAARIKIALAAAKGDSGSVAARTTSPGLTFVDDNVSQTVPTGNLAAGENIGVWAEQTLPTSDPAAKSTFTLTLAGSSI